MVMPEHQLQDSLVVLIDVLRMSSTVITGMGEGLRSAELFSSPSDVKKEAQFRSADKCILGGEAKRVLIPGFNRDNSPLSFVNCAEDATALMLTTNGTRALPWVRNAKFLVLGSLLNLHAVVSAITSNLQSVQSVLLVASGQDRGQTRSPDDELCIAMVLKTLVKQLDDPSKLILDETAAQWLSTVDGLDWEQFCDRFRQTHAAKELAEINLGSDVEWCLQVNKYGGVLPVYLHNCDSFVRMSIPGGSKSRVAKIPGRSRRMLRPRGDDSRIRVYVVAAPAPPGVFKGRLDSWAELTEEGRKIASILSQEPIEFLFCSPLRRARLIAQEIAKQYFAVLGKKGILLQDPNSVEVHNSLTATDFGEWSGLREDQVRSFLPGALEKWEQDPNFTEHEGESWSQVSTRISGGLAEIFGSERVLSSAKAVAIVSHESAVQTIYSQAKGLGQRDWCELNILPESLSCFDYIPSTKKWEVVFAGLLAEDFELRYSPAPGGRRWHRERAANLSKL